MDITPGARKPTEKTVSKLCNMNTQLAVALRKGNLIAKLEHRGTHSRTNK